MILTYLNNNHFNQDNDNQSLCELFKQNNSNSVINNEGSGDTYFRIAATHRPNQQPDYFCRAKEHCC